MMRIWLSLADIFICLLFFLSLILFFLNPPSYTHLNNVLSTPKKHCSKPKVVWGKLPFPKLDLNATMTEEELNRMGQLCQAEEYTIDTNIYLESTLNERLKALSTHLGNPVFIRIFKEEAILEVWIKTDTEYKHLKDYIICASSGHLGPKLKEGDKQAPEGFYRVYKHQLNPHSRFHLAFNLGYPNRYDKAHRRTGSFLMVHGNCVSVGCYAMTDEKIEEIYALVESALKNGQEYVWVHALPFRMTETNMALYEGNRWYEFWTELKEGYDYFEVEKLPPHIVVKKRHYTIHEANE